MGRRHPNTRRRSIFPLIAGGILVVHCNLLWAVVHLLDNNVETSQMFDSVRRGYSILGLKRLLVDQERQNIVRRALEESRTNKHPASIEKALKEKIWKFPPLVEPNVDNTNDGILAVVPNRQWWSPWVSEVSRSYPVLQDERRYAWCIPETQRTPSRIKSRDKEKEKAIGLLFVKPYKVTSNIGEGISISIAHNVGRRRSSLNVEQVSIINSTSMANSSDANNSSNMTHIPGSSNQLSHPCIHYNRHEFANYKNHGQRGSPSLLWTIVRKPAERDLSEVYFQYVSRKNVKPTDDHVIRILEGIKNRQIRHLAPSWASVRRLDEVLAKDRHPKEGNTTFSNSRTSQTSQADVANVIKNDIIGYYDFIGVSDRMDESLAVMKLLWDLETTDLIVLSTKSQHEGSSLTLGGYDDGSTRDPKTGGLRCVPIQETKVTSTVAEYLQTKHADHNADYFLYDAAVQSLDRTIHELGSNRVAAVVEELRKLQYLAETMCRPMAIFPCSEDGTVQVAKSKENCYVQDSGCGYQCVDHIMRQYELGRMGHVIRGIVQQNNGGLSNAGATQ
jgi:hypothetical protein